MFLVLDHFSLECQLLITLLFSLDQLPGMSADRPVPGFLLQEELVAPEDQRGASPRPGDGRRLPPDLFLLWIVSYRPMYPVL